MIVKLLTEHHLEFLSLIGGCRGSSESTHIKCHIVGNPMQRLKLFVFPWVLIVSHELQICFAMLSLSDKYQAVVTEAFNSTLNIYYLTFRLL